MTEGFKLFQSKIDNLATHSEMVMNGLDHLTKIHPFVSSKLHLFFEFLALSQYPISRRSSLQNGYQV